MKLLSLAALVLSSGVAVAAPVEREMVVHTTKTMLDVKLDATTVSCTNTELVVSAPKLGALTLMNHHDVTLGAPALSAGACEPGRMPQDIIDAANPVATAELVVKAVRRDRVDLDTQSCTTYLVERIETTIRGVVFGSEASTWLGSRPVAQCNGSDSPADDPGQLDDASAGGCSASRGNATWLGLVLALGLLVRRRR